jgi:hypothetical protein
LKFLLDWKSVNYVSGIKCKLCVRTDRLGIRFLRPIFSP